MSLYNRLLAEISWREANIIEDSNMGWHRRYVGWATAQCVHYRKTLDLHYPSRYGEWPWRPAPVSCGSCVEDWPCTDVVNLAEALGIAATVGEEHFAPEENTAP